MAHFKIARGSLSVGNGGRAIAQYHDFAWTFDGVRFPRVEVEGLLQAHFEDDDGRVRRSLGPAPGLRFLNASTFAGRTPLAKLGESLAWNHEGEEWATLRVSSLE